LELPLDSNSPFSTTLEQIASTDAILCSVHDDDTSDPKSLFEAKQSNYWTEWLAAIQSELESLCKKGVYEEVHHLPPHRQPVKCKWVLRIKRDKDGTISCCKARLVTKGFTQIPGQDFTFTFAPVARWDSICSLLCITALNDLELCQLDVKTAYLNGPLEEEIYMKALEGLTTRPLSGAFEKDFMDYAKWDNSGILPSIL
jgi:hypothetical protein